MVKVIMDDYVNKVNDIIRKKLEAGYTLQDIEHGRKIHDKCLQCGHFAGITSRRDFICTFHKPYAEFRICHRPGWWCLREDRRIPIGNNLVTTKWVQKVYVK